MRVTCQCGQPRDVATTYDARGHKPGHFVMPCCLAHYEVSGWRQGVPELTYYGRKDWKCKPPRIVGPDGKPREWPNA